MNDDGGMPESSPAPESGDQPGYSGGGTVERLLGSFADDGQLALVALRPDGEIVYASRAVDYVFGRGNTEVVGTNILTWLHPDDVDRAAFTLGQGSEIGFLPGVTRFMVAHADGSWMPAEVLGSWVTDGEEQLIGVYARKGLHDLLTEEILQLLMTGAPRADALAPVTNAIAWEEGGSHLSISWCDSDGFNQVSTGLPDTLGGGDGEDGTVWASARADGQARQGHSEDLDEGRRLRAAELGVSSYWIEPVEWDDDYPPAIVTVWTQGGPRAPVIHAYGMGVARHLVELILRWNEQQAALERAAHLDALTGLATGACFSRPWPPPRKGVRSSIAISTGSSRSMTRSATPPATRCCGRRQSGSPRASAPTISSPGSAGTSSPSSARGRQRPMPPRLPLASRLPSISPSSLTGQR